MKEKNDDNEGDGEGKGKGKGKERRKSVSEQERPNPTAGCRTVNEIPSGAFFWGGNSTEMERSREAQSFEIATHPHCCTTYVVWALRSGQGCCCWGAQSLNHGSFPPDRFLLLQRLPLAGTTYRCAYTRIFIPPPPPPLILLLPCFGNFPMSLPFVLILSPPSMLVFVSVPCPSLRSLNPPYPAASAAEI